MAQHPPKTVSVTELRTKTKEVIARAMSSDEPIYVLVHSDMPVYIARAKHTRAHRTPARRQKQLKDYAGIFADRDDLFPEGGLAYQRKIRSEWDD